MNFVESQSSFPPYRPIKSNDRRVLGTLSEPKHHAVNSGDRCSAFDNQGEHGVLLQGPQHNTLQPDKHITLTLELLQRRNAELETSNSTYLELITDLISDLKIKVAVLENELQRPRLNKEAATNGLAVVIEALSRSSPSALGCTSALTGLRDNNERNLRVTRSENAETVKTSKVMQELELEIELLRKTNRRLSRQLRQQHDAEPKLRGRKRCHSSCSSRERSRFSLMEDTAGDQILGSLLPDISCAEDDIMADSVQNLYSGPSSGDNNEITAGDAPAGEQQDFTSASSSKTSRPGAVPTCDPDYGMRSLSDLIDQEGVDTVEEHVPRRENRFMNISPDDIDREGDDIFDEKLLEEMKKFTKVPKISILQTGINIKEGFQRGESDFAVKDHSVMDCHAYALGCSDFPSSSLFRQDNLDSSRISLQPAVNHSFSAGSWSSLEQRNGAVNLHQQMCDRVYRFPLFFKHEIRYRPQETDFNYQRTVLISNLPKYIELREVLACLRGGSIVNAILADTLKIAGSMTAFIVFRYESDASRYVDFCAINPIQFPISSFNEEGERSIPRVTLLDSAAYPQKELPPDRSRCLCIANFPRELSIRSLEGNIACGNAFRAAALVEIWADKYRTLHLEFSSMSAAGSAFAILTHWHCYRGLNVHFERDPCAGYLQELLTVEPRKSMFPKGGFIDDVVEVREEEAEMEERRKWGGTRLDLGQETLEIAVAEEGDSSNQFLHIKNSAFRSGHSTDYATEITPSKHVTFEGRVTAFSTPDLNDAVLNRSSICWVDHKTPVGLAGSKHATLGAGFEDKSDSWITRTESFTGCSTTDYMETRGDGKANGLKCMLEDMDDLSRTKTVGGDDDAKASFTWEANDSFQVVRDKSCKTVSESVERMEYTKDLASLQPSEAVSTSSSSGPSPTRDTIFVRLDSNDLKSQKKCLSLSAEKGGDEKMNLDEIAPDSDMDGETGDLK